MCISTSGLHSAIAALTRGKSRTSAQIDRTELAILACSKRLGFVGGLRAYPVTLAPRDSSHNDSQLPLNPVCPVRKTLRPRQNEWSIMLVYVWQGATLSSRATAARARSALISAGKVRGIIESLRQLA